jgi:hypothetical protein
MVDRRAEMNQPLTLPFATFWQWLTTHPNCILRAGTPESIVYDDEDLHWLLFVDEPETLVLQVLRGKRVTAEILVAPEQIDYVQGMPGEHEGEYVFEAVAESESDRMAVYFFVMAHGWDVEDETAASRVH